MKSIMLWVIGVIVFFAVMYGMYWVAKTFYYYVGSTDTVYYLQFEKNESIGGYSTLYIRTYSDAERTILLNTQTILLFHGDMVEQSIQEMVKQNCLK